jgi:hypothetical protein
MKNTILTLLLVLALCLSACTKPAGSGPLIDDFERLTAELQGKTVTEVHDLLGEPSGMLSGMYGDVYQDSEGRSIIIYYDENGVVEVIKITVSSPVFQTAWANYAEDLRIRTGGLNAEIIQQTMPLSSVLHLPIFRFDSRADVEAFRNAYAYLFTFDQSHDEAPSFDDAVSAYDDAYFEENCLLCVYMTAGSGTFRFGVQSVQRDDAALCVYIDRLNDPETYTDDMAGWLILVEQNKQDIRNCTDFDALYAGLLEQ